MFTPKPNCAAPASEVLVERGQRQAELLSALSLQVLSPKAIAVSQSKARQSLWKSHIWADFQLE